MNDSSGYTEDIGSEMEAGQQAAGGSFSNIQERYVSESGHARLFTAVRYGKTYTLKTLKPDFAYTPVYRQALTKEFEIGIKLDHPYIRSTIGMEDVDGLGACIILEYVDGETLASALKGGRVDAALGRRIAVQTATAVAYLHSKQMVHRDIKPANIMITHNGHNVKLIDLSLADSDAYCVLKTPAGTRGYIAPEQLMPGAKTDTRADIYSLGVVMAEIARHTGDKAMAGLARKCTRRNANERPADSITDDGNNVVDFGLWEHDFGETR